ncbi:MAG: VWA domain-containing protein, partial [Streptosporangiales bacterium]|nr:VWA domain-containing protein [Streptosporangiales bacterium]
MRDVTETLLGFARTLRHAGVAASPERVQVMLQAVGELDVTDAADVYWAGRVSLCAEPDDLPTYDNAFAAYFGSDPTERAQRAARPAPRRVARLFETGGVGGEGPERTEERTTTASGADVLRHRDVARLSTAERAELRRLMALLRPVAPDRVSRRSASAHRGRVDVRRTVQAMLHAGGEVTTLAHRTRRRRPRRLVVLVDVSGSMRPYADALLRFAHVAVRCRPGNTEAFTVGTRLTRVTRQLRLRDPDKALAASSAAIPDWSGGTRLGEVLK